MPLPETDPRRWCAGLTFAFALLVLWRLGVPQKFVFDEVHYVPAARALLAGNAANTEHPMLAKEAIAAAIWLLGDQPVVWRLPSAMMGIIGLYAFGRALWWASQRRFATIAGMALLALNFTWFVQSRIAMLDMVMAGFAMIAWWQMAAVWRGARYARLRVILAGFAIGLSVAAKWSAAPALVLSALMMMLWQWRKQGWRRAGETALWLGLLPLAVYWISFAPGFAWPAADRIDPFAPLAWHRHMLALQMGVVQPHGYQSQWWQWALNWRPIWFFYEPFDGAQRGILLVGNPLAMLAGLPALGWCVWTGLRHGRQDALAIAALYVVSLGIWAINGKPVQFYYHYLLPGALLTAALALALDELWRTRHWWRLLMPATLAVSAALLVYFYPILAAWPLPWGKPSFHAWTWLPSWV